MSKSAILYLVLTTASCATASPPTSRVAQPVLAADEPVSSAGPTVRASQGCPAPRAQLCFVLEIVDIHTDATSEAKGFEELRARAAALESDAVIGAEFEHGAGKSHLAGMIVRYGAPLPPSTEIGVIEIPSDPDSQDKGLSALVARGREMGADRVVDVTFEHGEDGAFGRIRGRAVRYSR